MSESEVLEVIDRIATRQALKFPFGYFGMDDIAQEARRMCLEALPLYDTSRPLDPFLHKHTHNRLINLKRDKYRRYDCSCKSCYLGTPCQDDGSHCRAYLEWARRNFDKASLMAPGEYIETDSAREDTTFNDVVAHEEMKELLAWLPLHLSEAIKAHLNGVDISRETLREAEHYTMEYLYAAQE